MLHLLLMRQELDVEHQAVASGNTMETKPTTSFSVRELKFQATSPEIQMSILVVTVQRPQLITMVQIVQEMVRTMP